MRLKAARHPAGTGRSKPSPTPSPGQRPSSASGTSRWAPSRYGDGDQPTHPGRTPIAERLLVHVLQLQVEDLSVYGTLGGVYQPDQTPPQPPGTLSQPGTADKPRWRFQRRGASSGRLTWPAITRLSGSDRRLYSHVEPTQLHPSVIEHTRMGIQLLGRQDGRGQPRPVLATALAESLLLAGPLAFFDLRQPDDADATLVRALQAARGSR